MTTDPVELTKRLVKCASVTPEERGALKLLAKELTSAGFECHRVDRGAVSNLYARWGGKGHAKSFGFNGHTDVVPVGDQNAWTMDPFGAEVRDGWLYGRGATDMKSGVAAFAAAAIDYVRDTPPDGAVILAITGDEEGDAVDGTTAILDWMATNGEAMSVCIVGEPTCPETLGEMIKIGPPRLDDGLLHSNRRSGPFRLPAPRKNPVPALARLVDRLAQHELDAGSDHFDPSTLAATTFDTGNPANNVIPAACRATVNIRFNDLHSSASLITWLQEEAAKISAETGINIKMTTKVSGESFLTPPGPFSDLVAAAVQRETNQVPVLSTSGGTSDARFVQAHCPVVEFGLVGKTMHQVDERVEVAQIHALKGVYTSILRDYFA